MYGCAQGGVVHRLRRASENSAYQDRESDGVHLRRRLQPAGGEGGGARAIRYKSVGELFTYGH